MERVAALRVRVEISGTSTRGVNITIFEVRPATRMTRLCRDDVGAAVDLDDFVFIGISMGSGGPDVDEGTPAFVSGGTCRSGPRNLARMMTTTHIGSGIVAIARVPRRRRRGTRTVFVVACACVSEMCPSGRSLWRGSLGVVGVRCSRRWCWCGGLKPFPGVVILVPGSRAGVRRIGHLFFRLFFSFSFFLISCDVPRHPLRNLPCVLLQMSRYVFGRGFRV